MGTMSALSLSLSRSSTGSTASDVSNPSRPATFVAASMSPVVGTAGTTTRAAIRSATPSPFVSRVSPRERSNSAFRPAGGASPTAGVERSPAMTTVATRATHNITRGSFTWLSPVDA